MTTATAFHPAPVRALPLGPGSATLDGTTLLRRRRAVDLAVADVWLARRYALGRGLYLYARDDSGELRLPLEPSGRRLPPAQLLALAGAIRTGPHRLPAEEYQAETVVAHLRRLAGRDRDTP